MTSKKENKLDTKAKSNTDENVSTPGNHSIAGNPSGARTGDSMAASKKRSTSDSGSNEGQPDAPLDPFHPDQLRLSQDFGAHLGVRQALLTVPVRKPDKVWWIQTHPNPTYHIDTAVIELKEDRETYLVAQDLWPELATEAVFVPRSIFTTVNRQGVVFLWPIRLPGPDGKQDEWSRSALEAATMASGKWVRVQANMSLGAYEVWEATADLPDPKWPNHTFSELLRIAFQHRYIEKMDHPVLRRLRGDE